MNSNILKFLLFFILSMLSLAGQSKDIYFGDQYETIYIQFGEEIILKFPSLVKTVSKASEFEIAPLDSNNPDYSALTVKSILRKSQGEVVFILDTGNTVKLKLRTVNDEVASQKDQVYILKHKSSLINKERSPVNVSALDLMKAMNRNGDVTGFKKRMLVRTLWHLSDDLKAQLVTVYSGEQYTGYVFKLINDSSSNIKINLADITLGTPNTALLSQVDQSLISSKKSNQNWTYLRIVTRASSFYSDIKLPFERIKKE